MLTVLDECSPAPPAADARPRAPVQLRLQAEGLLFPDRPPDVRWAAAAEGEAVKIQHEGRGRAPSRRAPAPPYPRRRDAACPISTG